MIRSWASQEPTPSLNQPDLTDYPWRPEKEMKILKSPWEAFKATLTGGRLAEGVKATAAGAISGATLGYAKPTFGLTEEKIAEYKVPSTIASFITWLIPFGLATKGASLALKTAMASKALGPILTQTAARSPIIADVIKGIQLGSKIPKGIQLTRAQRIGSLIEQAGIGAASFATVEGIKRLEEGETRKGAIISGAGIGGAFPFALAGLGGGLKFVGKPLARGVQKAIPKLKIGAKEAITAPKGVIPQETMVKIIARQNAENGGKLVDIELPKSIADKIPNQWTIVSKIDKLPTDIKSKYRSFLNTGEVMEAKPLAQIEGVGEVKMEAPKITPLGITPEIQGKPPTLTGLPEGAILKEVGLPMKTDFMTKLSKGAIMGQEGLQNLAKYAKEHKGITVRLSDGKIATEGFSTSILDKAAEVRLPMGDTFDKLFIEQFNKLKKQYASNPNIHMGGWLEGNEFVVDTTRVRTNLKESLYDAIIKRQDASGDLAKYAKGEEGAIYITPEILRSLKPLSRGSFAGGKSVFRDWEEAVKYYTEKNFKNPEGFVLPQEITKPIVQEAAVPIEGKPPFVLGEKKPSLFETQLTFINAKTNRPITSEKELPAVMDITKKKGPTNFVKPPQLVKTAEEAKAELKHEQVTSYPEIQLDVAAQKYNETANFDDFVASLPQGSTQKMTPQEAIEKGFTTRQTQAGKTVAAVRKSGVGVSKEFGEYKNFKDVPQTLMGGAKSPVYWAQEMDGGEFLGPTTKVVMTAYHVEKAADNFKAIGKANIFRIRDLYKITKSKWEKNAGQVAEIMNFEDMEKSVVELLEMPKISGIVENYPKNLQERIVAYGAEMRNILREEIRKRNIIRAKRGETLIPERINYIPHVRESIIWTKLNGLKPLPEETMQKPGLPLFIKPSGPKSYREMARRADIPDYPRELNITKLVLDYIDDSAKRNFFPYIIDLVKESAQVFRSLGFPNNPNTLENWGVESYAGIRTGLSRMLGLPRIITWPLYKIRALLSSSTFGTNIDWSLFVQTSSSGLIVLREGIGPTGWGTFNYLFNRSWRKLADANSWIIAKKMKEAGVAAYQDLGENFIQKYSQNKSLWGKAVSFANYLTQTIEKNLTGIAVSAAYRNGFKKGFRGGALWDYASMGGMKTQSAYHLSGLPGILRTREIGAIVPFQTFSFEMLNTIREMGWLFGKSKTGAWKRIAADSIEGQNLIANRLKMLGKFIGVILVTNLIADKVINRKPWNLSSFVPFYSILTGGINAGNPWGYPLPTRYSYEAYQGFSNIIKYGNWKKLRSFMIKYHAIGGIQMNRMLEGMEAISEGKVSTVSGKEMFGVDEDEWLSALIHGPYGTREGREYLEQLEKSRGGLPAEILGIPLPVKTTKKPAPFFIPGTTRGGIRSWAR